ncbi:MAG: alpha/beta hydrolase [Lachnotalea sp.]
MNDQDMKSSNTICNKKLRKIQFTKKRVILLGIGIVIAAVIIGIVKYLTFYIPADEPSISAMISSDKVTVEQIGDTIAFTPTQEIPTIGYIYYPGGQVEPESFAYAANKIAQNGIQVIIQRMPFNLAIFGKNKAFTVMDTYTDIEKWYIGGFSLGGVVACMAASDKTDAFEGIVLYASYTTKSSSLTDSGLKVFSLSGEKDGLATSSKIDDAKKYFPVNAQYVQIAGGNHTQFAIYGKGELQKGDNKATISRIKQQEIVIDKTVAFLKQE